MEELMQMKINFNKVSINALLSNDVDSLRR